MTFFILSALGAFLTILSFLLGFILGRKFPERLKPPEVAEDISGEREKEAQALRELFSYSALQAYGGR